MEQNNKKIILDNEKTVQILERYAMMCYAYARNASCSLENKILLEKETDVWAVLPGYAAVAKAYVMSRMYYALANEWDEAYCSGNVLLYGEPLEEEEE